MFFSTTKKIWEYLEQTYSMKKDTTACYEVEMKFSIPRESFSHMLLWEVEWFVDRARSISEFEDNVHY